MVHFSSTIDSACGPLLIVADADGVLTHLQFLDAVSGPTVLERLRRADVEVLHDAGHTGEIESEIKEYFAGERMAFEIAVAPEGTPFQRRVWEAIRTIGYGETRTYGEIAAALERPGAARAVGGAGAANPIPIVIPCHRVVGSDGALVGFGGGLKNKARLLRMERHYWPSDEDEPEQLEFEFDDSRSK